MAGRLELYRDHKALLNLIDALTIRKLEYLTQKNELEVITFLQKKLLDRGLQYHHERGHCHVIERLTALQSKLRSASVPTFFEDDDSDLIPTPFLSVQRSNKDRHTQSSTSESVKLASKSVTSAAGMFASKERAREERPHVNLNYSYDSDDIQTILSERLKTLDQQPIVLASVNMSYGAAPGNQISAVLHDFIQAQHGVLPLDKRLIIPIAVGEHWVGVCIRVKPNRDTRITFFDSFKNKETDELYMNRIRTDISSILFEGKNMFEPVTIHMHPHCLQQKDGTSCGAFLIENIYYYLKGQGRPFKDDHLMTAQRIRYRHIEILQTQNPVYLETFKNKQGLVEADHGARAAMNVS